MILKFHDEKSGGIDIWLVPVCGIVLELLLHHEPGELFDVHPVTFDSMIRSLPLISEIF